MNFGGIMNALRSRGDEKISVDQAEKLVKESKSDELNFEELDAVAGGVTNPEEAQMKDVMVNLWDR